VQVRVCLQYGRRLVGEIKLIINIMMVLLLCSYWYRWSTALFKAVLQSWVLSQLVG